jgi:hypothetical protein
VGQEEARFDLGIVFILAQDRCMVCAKRTIGWEIIFGQTRWYSYVTWVKWKLVSVQLEIALILTQDGYTVCAEHAIGSGIILRTADETLR